MQNEAGRTELDILNHVLNTFDTKGWTQEVAARDAEGTSCNYYDDDAECFCLLGAVYLAMFDLGGYTTVGTPRSVSFLNEDQRLVNSATDMLVQQMKKDEPERAHMNYGLVWFNDRFVDSVEPVKKLVRDTIESNS